MNMGGRTKQRRLQIGWTQEQLSAVSDVPQGTISKIERTDQAESKFVVQLATALGVLPLWLQTGQLPMLPEQRVAEQRATYSTESITAQDKIMLEKLSRLPDSDQAKFENLLDMWLAEKGLDD